MYSMRVESLSHQLLKNSSPLSFEPKAIIFLENLSSRQSLASLPVCLLYNNPLNSFKVYTCFLAQYRVCPSHNVRNNFF